MRPIRLAWAIALLILSVAPAGYAAANDDVSAILKAADKAYRDGDHPLARDKYAEALKLRRSPKVLLQLARCEERLGRLAVAQRTYREAIAAALPRPAGEAKQAARDAESDLNKLTPRVPQVRIVIKGPHPDEVTATLDGKPCPPGEWRWWLPLDPGKHRIQLEAAGWQPAEAQTEVREGERKSTEVVFQRLEVRK